VTRAELEHVVRAAADAVREDEFVIVGSQAVLGQFPHAPGELLRSMEADIYPVADPDKAEAIDGAIGEGSPFHDTFGYYAHGVGPETAKAPAGWESRLISVVVERPSTGPQAIARCLEIHDLVLSKCAASRERDWEYAAAALKAGIVKGDVRLARLQDLPVTDDLRERVDTMLRDHLLADARAGRSAVTPVGASAWVGLGASVSRHRELRPD